MAPLPMTPANDDSDATGTPRRAGLPAPLAILLVGRLGVWLTAYLGLVFLPASARHTNAFPGNYFLDGWIQWDSHWYARIARNGYDNLPNDAVGGGRDTAFFPLFPLAARAVGYLVGGKVELAGLIVANVSFILAGILIFELVARDLGAEMARRTLLLISVYPGSYCFSAMYSESLFLLCAAGAFWFARGGRWWLAGLCAAAAGATRPVGFLLAVPLTIFYLSSIDWQARRIGRSALSLLLCLGGTVAFMLFLWIRFGNPIQYAASQAQSWGYEASMARLMTGVNSIRSASFGSIASGNFDVITVIHLCFTLAALALLPIVWRKLPAAYAGWATAMLLVALTRWNTYVRQVAVVFPLFVLLALLLHRPMRLAVFVALCAMLLALFTIMFTNGHWVA
jgi:Mannosyltransferase (PIG-V)